MTSDNQDLPAELLEKLRNLELELEDGDITQKGFEKKKASLLQQYARDNDYRASTANSSQAQEGVDTEISTTDFGPEPSAADVVDFLDYLPSPTHSPPKATTGASYMEENHRQLQEQTHRGPSPALTMGSTTAVQPQYRPYTAPPATTAQWQQQPYYAYSSPTRPAPDGQYYHPSMTSPRPSRPPYDSWRPQYPSGTHPLYNYPQRPVPSPPPPPSSYRPGPAPPSVTHPGGSAYRPMYSTPPQRPVVSGPQPIPAGSPRPLYRPGIVPPQQQQQQSSPRPPVPYGGTAYRPSSIPPQTSNTMMPLHARTSSLDARSDMAYHNNPRPTYYGTPRPTSQHVPQANPYQHRNLPPEAWRN